MNNHGLRWGLIGGLAIVTLYLVLYLIEPKYVFGVPSYLDWLIIPYILYKAGADERTEQGGYISWVEALKPMFLAFVVSSFIYTAFLFLLYNVIDPGMAEIQREATMEMANSFSGFLGEEGMEQMEESLEVADHSFSIPTATFTFFWRLIFPGFVFAAITALFVKKDSPETIM